MATYYPANADPSLYEFMFANPSQHAWFIDSITEETYTGVQVKERVDSLALGTQFSQYSMPSFGSHSCPFFRSAIPSFFGYQPSRTQISRR